MDYTDILYTEEGGLVTITINRPEALNAFRPRTIDELVDAEHIAGLSNLAFGALSLYYGTPESNEGHAAFVEKRPANFGQFRRGR